MRRLRWWSRIVHQVPGPYPSGPTVSLQYSAVLTMRHRHRCSAAASAAFCRFGSAKAFPAAAAQGRTPLSSLSAHVYLVPVHSRRIFRPDLLPLVHYVQTVRLS